MWIQNYSKQEKKVLVVSQMRHCLDEPEHWAHQQERPSWTDSTERGNLGQASIDRFSKLEKLPETNTYNLIFKPRGIVETSQKYSLNFFSLQSQEDVTVVFVA